LRIVKRPAFISSEQDDDGLSVHRELFINAEKLAWKGRSPGNYYIARFSVKELTSQHQLTFTPSPDIRQPAGHCVIPELRFGQKKKQLQRDLAEMATQRIIYSPPPAK
jgi:hypothetical protein